MFSLKEILHELAKGANLVHELEEHIDALKDDGTQEDGDVTREPESPASYPARPVSAPPVDDEPAETVATPVAEPVAGSVTQTGSLTPETPVYPDAPVEPVSEPLSEPDGTIPVPADDEPEAEENAHG